MQGQCVRECEKMLKIVQRSRDSRLDLVGSSWLANRQKLHTCQACREAEPPCQLKHYRTKSPVWPFNYLAAGTRGSVKSRGQATSQLCFEKLDSSHSTLTLVYIHLIPTKWRELLERILREKPQRKTRLTHPQSSHKDSSNSSTLSLSIVTFFRGILPKPFFIIPTSVRMPFGAQEAVRKGPISYWLMLWAIPEFGKLKKKQVWCNLVGVGVWRAQVYWVDQTWRVFCCSCIPTTFFSRLFISWRVVERFYAKGFGFLFDNTSLCCPCVYISLPLIFAI